MPGKRVSRPPATDKCPHVNARHEKATKREQVVMMQPLLRLLYGSRHPIPHSTVAGQGIKRPYLSPHFAFQTHKFQCPAVLARVWCPDAAAASMASPGGGGGGVADDAAWSMPSDCSSLSRET